MEPWVLHIDGDGFFAYCEIARFPHLKGKPVVVGEDRGIACAMTYEAKKLGITRATPIFKIREFFPEVTILSSHFELYEHYAKKLTTLVAPSVNTIERYSIDECFGLKYFPTNTPKEDLQTWLEALKLRVQAHTGLTYSFGLARTKVLAKIASKYQKPDGCTVIMPSEEEAILKITPVKSLWGIGWRLARRFETTRVKTAYDFFNWSEAKVTKSFASPTVALWHELHGKMVFQVGEEVRDPKSLQATKSFTPGTTDEAFLIAELLHNADVVFSRMREYDMATNVISIFIKTTDKKYHSISFALPHYTNNILDITEMLQIYLRKIKRPGVRYKTTGITVWELKPINNIQEDLFGAQNKQTEKGKVMQAIDAVRNKYGNKSVFILATMPSKIDRETKQALRNSKAKYEYGLPLPYMGEVW